MALAVGLILLGALSSKAQSMASDTVPSPMKIVFFTDVHARTEWDTPEALKQAAEAITAQQADLVICGGDMITEGNQCSEAMAAPRWAAYRAMRTAIQPEPVEVLGNHDLVGLKPSDGSPPIDDPRAQARRQLGLSQTYRSFNQNGFHFILLDSIEIIPGKMGYRGFIGQEQMDWLRKDLSRVASNTPIVLVTHTPLLTERSQGEAHADQPPLSNRYFANTRKVLAAFKQHHLLVVLQGHQHINTVMRWQDITFITGGAICGEWWRGPRKGTPLGFGVLLLSPNRVEWNYHTYGWIPRRPIGE